MKPAIKKIINSIAFVFLIISLVGCNFVGKSQGELDVNENSFIIGLNTTLYRSIDDDSDSETIEVGTLVEKTGKCRESKKEDEEVFCPIKTVHSLRKGWVLEHALVKFEDYLPANED